MGWTGLYDKPSNIPTYFKEQWECNTMDINGKRRITCLGQAFVGRFVLYGVWEVQKDDNKPYQFATVTLIQYGNKKDTSAFYYKDMDESVGPMEYKCPKTLLKKLKTPASNDYARAWRKACWQNALCLTKESTIKKARRIWKTNHDEAITLLSTWNNSHPTDTIQYHY